MLLSKRPYNLPVMSSLVSFEAAGRHGSFKLAASELNVTPAAVSLQVKSLESELNCKLFHRFHRGVELTEIGAQLLISLQRNFREMSDAVNQARSSQSDDAITIRASTAVSSLWLSSRLAKFWRTHRDIKVEQIVTDTPAAESQCDLSIHYGNPENITAEYKILYRDSISALCSPDFKKSYSIKSIPELSNIPIIHLESQNSDWTTWKEWCALQGFKIDLPVSYAVNNYMIAIQAAEDGVGAVLGWNRLTESLQKSGRLVPLLPNTINSDNSFNLLLHSRNSRKARLVFDQITD